MNLKENNDMPMNNVFGKFYFCSSNVIHRLSDDELLIGFYSGEIRMGVLEYSYHFIKDSQIMFSRLYIPKPNSCENSTYDSNCLMAYQKTLQWIKRTSKKRKDCGISVYILLDEEIDFNSIELCELF